MESGRNAKTTGLASLRPGRCGWNGPRVLWRAGVCEGRIYRAAGRVVKRRVETEYVVMVFCIVGTSYPNCVYRIYAGSIAKETG